MIQCSYYIKEIFSHMSYNKIKNALELQGIVESRGQKTYILEDLEDPKEVIEPEIVMA